MREQTGRRRSRRARQLPLRRARRPRRRDGRRRAARRAREPLAAMSSTRSSTSPAAAARSTTAPRPTATRGRSEISRVHQAYGRAYQLPHTTAHNESCANIGMILWSERMLALTGDARYADVIEQIAYNSAARGHQPRRHAVLLHQRRSARCATCPTRCACRATPGCIRCPSRPRPTSGCASRTSAASAARRTSPGRSPASTSARRRSARTGSTCTCTAAATCASRLPTVVALALRESSDYPWDGRIAFTVDRGGGRRHPVPPARPGMVDGCRAHRQR